MHRSIYCSTRRFESPKNMVFTIKPEILLDQRARSIYLVSSHLLTLDMGMEPSAMDQHHTSSYGQARRKATKPVQGAAPPP
jgi:hypothetical protein